MPENIAIDRTVESLIPALTLDQIILIGFVGLIVLAGVGLLIYLLWDKIKQSKNQDFYKDAYTNLIALCKNNCPTSMLGQQFRKAPDFSHEGVNKGFIQGYNLMKFANRFYDVIVYNPIPFRLINPSSWFSPDRVAFLSADKEIDEKGKQKRDRFNRPIFKWHSALMGALTWYTIGTERIGFFEYAVNDLNLTPKIVATELTDTVGLTAVSGLLKELGGIVGDSLHSNPDIRGSQKLSNELVVNKR